MIWAGISWKGKTELAVVEGTMNAVAYTSMLQDYFFPFAEKFYPEGCVLQQDNAPAHSARHTRDFFMDMEVTDLDWSAKSPDLNCIENAWGELTRRLYDGGRQFDTVEDLTEALNYEWDNLSMDYIRKLIESMPNRVRECQLKGGRITNY